jgi:hypothetical protein
MMKALLLPLLIMRRRARGAQQQQQQQQSVQEEPPLVACHQSRMKVMGQLLMLPWQELSGRWHLVHCQWRRERQLRSYQWMMQVTGSGGRRGQQQVKKVKKVKVRRSLG